MRAPCLRHETVDDAVEHDPVVEARFHQFLDARDMPRCKVRPHLDHDLPFGGFQCQRVFRLCHCTLLTVATTGEPTPASPLRKRPDETKSDQRSIVAFLM